MNKLLVVSLLALSFATGFTCSKNAPQQQAAAPEVKAPAQADMAAPAGQAAPASADAAPAAAPAPTETK